MAVKTVAPTTDQVAERRAVLESELADARNELAKARQRAAARHVAGERLPDDLLNALTHVRELEAVAEGYAAIAAAAEYRELGFAIAHHEAEIENLNAKLPNLERTAQEAFSANAPITDGRPDYETKDRLHQEAEAALLAVRTRISRLADTVQAARDRRAQLTRVHGAMLDALWLPERVAAASG